MAQRGRDHRPALCHQGRRPASLLPLAEAGFCRLLPPPDGAHPPVPAAAQQLAVDAAVLRQAQPAVLIVIHKSRRAKECRAIATRRVASQKPKG